MVDNEIKPDKSKVHLLNDIIELGPCEHLECISIDVEYLVRLDLSMATLYQTLISEVLIPWVLGILSILLGVEALYLLFPFLLDYLDHRVLGCLALGCGVARLRVDCEGFGGRFGWGVAG